MAKSLITINMNYSKTMKQADRLDEAAALLRKAANNHLEDGISQLSSVWRSDTASGYFSKAERIRNDLLKEAKEVAREASTLRVIAKNTYEAEKKAYILAKTRNH